jgi:hypothetical protein
MSKEELDAFEDEVIGKDFDVKIDYIDISDVKPYKNNPRFNDSAVDLVVKSIREFGLKQPIVLDKNNEIVVGHTRMKALEKLGAKRIPFIRADDLSEEQVKAYRIMDNKSNELAGWNNELLKFELDSLKDVGYDLDLTGFSVDEIDLLTEKELLHSYTEKIITPVYEPTLTKPELGLLFDDEKYKNLVKKIDESNVAGDVKEFLKLAATRHIIFNYRNIANFYAHSDKNVQELMEESALVIIDFDKAIELGYVELMKDIFESGEFDEE